MAIKAEPEDLRAEASNIEQMGQEFGDMVDQRQSAIDGLDWQGKANIDFVAMFNEARTQFRDVTNELADIANILRQVAENLEQADHSLSR